MMCAIDLCRALTNQQGIDEAATWNFREGRQKG